MLKKIKKVRPKRVGAADAKRVGRIPELEERIVELAASGALDVAAANAIRAQRAAGLPVTFMRGRKIIQQFPDGREEILGVVPRPPFKRPKGVARIVRRPAK